MQIINYETVAFPVDVDFLYTQNESGTEYILAELLAEEKVDVRFKVKETDENGKDIYSVMANGSKIGTINKEDREMFEHNIKNATSAELDIREICDEEDTPVYIVKAILHVPYVVAPKDIQERVKNREKAIIFAIAVLIINAAVGGIRAEWISTILSIIGAGIIYYWAFIKKNGKIYDFIMKKERKIIDLF